MFRVRRIVVDRSFCPIGVPQDPADHKVVEVVRNCANRDRLVPNAHVNRPSA